MIPDSLILMVSFSALRRDNGQKAVLDYYYISCCVLMGDSLMYQYRGNDQNADEIGHSYHFADQDSSLRMNPDFRIQSWAWGYKIKESEPLDHFSFISSELVTFYPEKALKMERLQDPTNDQHYILNDTINTMGIKKIPTDSMCMKK